MIKPGYETDSQSWLPASELMFYSVKNERAKSYYFFKIRVKYMNRSVRTDWFY